MCCSNSTALALEFAALVRLRRAEPELRGAFRVPVGVPGIGGARGAADPAARRRRRARVRNRAIGLPGVLVALALAAAGPPLYAGLLARRARLEPGRAP